MSYLTGEIDSSHIAPIRLYWIDNVIALTSSFTERRPFEENNPQLLLLDEETVQHIIHDNLDIVTTDYFLAMKKSILDYVLLDLNERKRLGINYVHKPVPFWGTEKSRAVVADHDWRANYHQHKAELLQELVICSASTWGMMHCWEIEFRPQCKLLLLPRKGDPRMTIE